METRDKKILTVLICCFAGTLLLTWFTPAREITTISGMDVICSPKGTLILFGIPLMLLGIWGEPVKLWRIVLGALLMLTGELFSAATWYILTITGEFNLEFCLSCITPEFYIASALTVFIPILSIYLVYRKKTAVQ